MSIKGLSSRLSLAFCALLLIHFSVGDSSNTTVLDISLGTVDDKTGLLEYIIIMEVNVSEVILIEQLKTILQSANLPLLIDSTTEISDLNITTVCRSDNATTQCRCEDQYFWPCDKCRDYGSCDAINSISCGCINGNPKDGQFCQPINELNTSLICPTHLPTTEYLLEVELDLTYDVFYKLPFYWTSLSLSFMINNTMITEMNFTTVCYLYSNYHNCYCHYPYSWPCDKCRSYGFCNPYINTSCVCSTGIPYDGQLCQPINELNTNSPCSPITEYLIEVDIDTVDLTDILVLQTLQTPYSVYPPRSFVSVTKMNITTVCLRNNAKYQCTCQDQYLWPCDKCTQYGSCDDITNTSTCGCINGIPDDGQFCQPISELNSSLTCPPQAPKIEHLIEIELNMMDTRVIDRFRNYGNARKYSFIMNNFMIAEINVTTMCYFYSYYYYYSYNYCNCEYQYYWPCDTCRRNGYCSPFSDTSCFCSSGIPYNGQFCQPTDELNTISPCSPINNTEYLIEVDIDTVDLTNVLVLQSLQTPYNLYSSQRYVSVTTMNFTTVCLRKNTTYQCSCQDQYFWPCDMCTQYGSCDDITNTSCGCINGIPNDRQLCQPISELNASLTCPPPAPTAEHLIEIEIDMMNSGVIDRFRNYGRSRRFPFIINNIMIIEINVTTMCYNSNCNCEYQYYWPCDTCRRYGYCSTFSDTFCFCSSGIPYDGQFCQPPNELNTSSPCSPITEHMIEAEIDTVDLTNIFVLQNRRTPYVPHSLMSYFSITALDITTVCLRNDASYQCTCQSQYFWPSDKCRKYGFCDDIISTSCGCINGIPDDGQLCQPINALNITAEPLSHTIPTETTTRKTTTEKPTKPTIPTIPPTTRTTEPPTKPTGPSTSTSTTTTTIPKPKKKVSLSLKINEEFHLDLTNKISLKYKKYEADIKRSIDASYSKVAGYEQGSAEVTGFRPGSVVADFSITATSETLDLVSANQLLAKSLSDIGYTVASDSFTRSVQDKLSTGQIYPGETLKLACTIPESNISWTKDGTVLTSSDKYVITGNTLGVTKASSDDSGTYACTTTWNSMPYVVWESIPIPKPNLQLTYSKFIKCEDAPVSMQCCDSSYNVTWSKATSICATNTADPTTRCITCDVLIKKQDCQAADKNILITCELQRGGYSNSSTITSTTKSFKCFDDTFGGGNEGDQRTAICGGGTNGEQTAQCNSLGRWEIIEDVCVLPAIQLLKDRSENLNVTSLPQFVNELKNASEANVGNITKSSATIVAIVEILQKVASTAQSISVNQPIMEDFLKTVDIIGSPKAVDTWEDLNANSKVTYTSSALLKAVEDMGQRLSKESMSIKTNSIQLTRTNRNGSYLESFHKNNTQVQIPVISEEMFITVIVFSSFDNVLPVRTSSGGNERGSVINGHVVVVQANKKVTNLSFSYSIINETLVEPQCVFWNFNLLNNRGGWDSTGCRVKSVANQTTNVTCECDHTTSFSMLMSPYYVGSDALDIITYIFLGISMGSLVLCLIIEIIIWKTVTRNDTSYLRHVAIVNIAVSLLIACIWFIVGASIVQRVGPCSAATFFTHFFFLAVFFWMLMSALFLLYRTIVVFSSISRAKLMAISFTVGYGAPLLIAVITVASTAGNRGYIQEENYCWLNWSKTKALLAFVIPVITIVVINLLVLIVVLCKILRRGVNNAIIQPDEKHALVVIAKCVGILSPLFGLTWGFGIGTMVSLNFGIHVVFVVLTSLQGFFILLFGLLVDSKVRETLAGKFSLKNLSSNRTRSTTGGQSSSGLMFFQRLRPQNVFNISEGEGILSSSSNTVTNH